MQVGPVRRRMRGKLVTFYAMGAQVHLDVQLLITSGRDRRDGIY